MKNFTAVVNLSFIFSVTWGLAVPSESQSRSFESRPVESRPVENLTVESRISECPPGFSKTSIERVCQEKGVYHALVYSKDSALKCSTGYETIAGIGHCLASDSVVDIAAGLLLVAQKKGGLCPQNFRSERNSKICSAEDLMIEKRGRSVARFSRRASGLIGVSSEDAFVESSRTDCPAGFLRPPGMSFCIASALVYATEQQIRALGLRYEDSYEDSDCPDGFIRHSNGFCVPERSLPIPSVTELTGRVEVCITCDQGSRGGWDDVVDIDWDITAEGCPAQTIEVWWDMPVYDEQGVFVEGFVPTRLCLPDDIGPAY